MFELDKFKKHVFVSLLFVVFIESVWFMGGVAGLGKELSKLEDEFSVTSGNVVLKATFVEYSLAGTLVFIGESHMAWSLNAAVAPKWIFFFNTQ